MRSCRRLWVPLLVLLAVLAAACAAEETATGSSGEAPPAVVQTEPPASEQDATSAASEVQPITAADGETEPEAALESAPATTTTTSAAPEVEPEPGAATSAAPEADAEPEPETDTVPDPEPETGTAPEPVSEPSSGVAGVLGLLDDLVVAAEQPGGYDRDLFRHWIDADGDGCDTRREVLLAEAVVAPTRGSGCSLSGGEWISRYDAKTDTGSGRGFDVDHLVPLAEAWASGARSWNAQRREGYANDLGFVDSLVAVSAGSNRSKGAQDPTTWMPPEAAQRCWYAAAWVHVKTRWSLTTDTAEAGALRGVLSGCSDEALDVGVPAPVVQQQTAATPEEPAAEPEDPVTTQPPEPGCHPAYTPCLPDLPGDAVNCGDLTADQKPVTVNEIGVDPYRLDRDRNGVGCTS